MEAEGGRPAVPPVRFGLIGCGDIGIKDAESIVASHGGDLVACHDVLWPLAADVAERFGVRTEPHVEALLASRDVEAVLIATPHDTHEAIALAALDAGKHVLLEKPLAHDLTSARRIAAAADASPLTMSVLFPMRSDKRLVGARDAIGAGLLGAPLGVCASYLVDKPRSYFHGGFSQRAQSSWRLSKARSGGGFLIMNLVHQLDAIRALLGTEADHVYADMTPSAIAPEIEDVTTLVVRFGSVIATLAGGGSVAGGGGQQLLLWGEAGRIQVLPEYSITTRVQAPDVAVVTADDPRPGAIDVFAASVRDSGPVDVSVRDALAVQAIVEAAYESALLGRAVSPAVTLSGSPP
jgi:predicted dehydrogenase